MPSRSRVSSPAAEAEEVTFEQALEELEGITHALDGEAHGLDELVAKYERGMGLLALCQKQLDAAQLRIEQISRRADSPAEATRFSTTTPGSARSAAAPYSPPPAAPAAPPSSSDDSEIRLF